MVITEKKKNNSVGYINIYMYRNKKVSKTDNELEASHLILSHTSSSLGNKLLSDFEAAPAISTCVFPIRLSSEMLVWAVASQAGRANTPPPPKLAGLWLASCSESKYLP